MKKNTSSKKKSAAKKPRSKRWIWAVAIIAVFAAAALGAYGYCAQGHKGETAWIYIPGGASQKSVEDSIISSLGSDEGALVIRLWNFFGNDPQTARGAYKVTKGQPAWRTARNISHGLQTPVKVTWNSARTLDQMAETVSRNLEFDGDDFVAACESVLGPKGYDEATYAAAFLPDTYEFYWGSTPDDVIKKMLSYRDKFWNEERTAKAKKLGLTPIEVATVASIVEEETAKTDEMPKVARLYLNRLKENMPLQADPTVKFAIGDFSIRRVTNEMLRTESPYNTYRVKGLPPGPIRLASKSTMDAVLDAPEHDYIYMCAKEDFSGYHNFATDYATHMANARRYQAELDRRKIH